MALFAGGEAEEQVALAGARAAQQHDRIADLEEAPPARVAMVAGLAVGAAPRSQTLASPPIPASATLGLLCKQ